MDQNSGHHIFCTRGYHIGSNFGARAVVPLPPGAHRRPSDPQGTMDPGVYICPVSDCALDVALYHAPLSHIQFKLQGWKQFCETQETVEMYVELIVVIHNTINVLLYTNHSYTLAYVGCIKCI